MRLASIVGQSLVESVFLLAIGLGDCSPGRIRPRSARDRQTL